MSSPTRSADRTPGKLPLVVLVLAAGTFLMGTTEFVVAGLLPEMAGDLGVSVSRAGLLITAFALGMVVGSPLMTIATLHLPRRTTLVLALLMFALGQVIVALSSSFAVVLAARVLTALATGAFWSVAAVVATAAAGPARSSRALGLLIGGLTLANVIGVPLGTWVGQYGGWRSPFWILGVLATAAAAAIGRFIPDDTHRETPSVRAELAALRSGRLWLALSAAALIMGGVMATYSYISPLLTDRAGVPEWAVPLVLVGFGAGALIGTTTGGRLGDHHPTATTVTAATAASLTLFLLIPFSSTTMGAIVLVALMGLTGFAVNPVISALAIRFAGSAPTLAAALSTSAFNVGIAFGSLAGGIALNSSLGDTGPVLVGAVLAALTLAPLGALARTHEPARPETTARPPVSEGTGTPHPEPDEAGTHRADADCTTV
ncbi:MFS transporter [Streptomyces coeruleorubidus]